MTLSIFCLEFKWSLWFGTFFEHLSQSENFSEIKQPLMIQYFYVLSVLMYVSTYLQGIFNTLCQTF